MSISKVEKHIINKDFDKAYETFMGLKKQKGKTEETLEVSKKLSEALRRECKDLANRRAERDAIRLEKILREVIKFNSETIYK